MPIKTNQGQSESARRREYEEDIELSRSIQNSLKQQTGRRSVLRPYLAFLAEYKYLDLPYSAAYQFVKAKGIPISYTAMRQWMVRAMGSESGPNSKAASIIQAAVDRGEFESPDFQSKYSKALVGNSPMPAVGDQGDASEVASTGQSSKNFSMEKSDLGSSASVVPPVDQATDTGKAVSKPSDEDPVQPNFSMEKSDLRNSPVNVQVAIDPEIEKKELMKLRVATIRQLEKEMRADNPYEQIAERSKKDERSKE